MPPIAVLVAGLFLFSPQPACPDLPRCRAAALEAYERNEHERFHDLAWAAYRHAGGNDREVMLLLARAQSLSGRPGDALVMLQRVARNGGVPADVLTHDDFAAVRALPQWEQGASLVGASHQRARVASPEGARVASLEGARVASPEGAPGASREGARGASPEGAPGASREGAASAVLPFATLLSPTSLAYDAVSKRFLIADRQARRIAIIDENTGQVSTLAGAQAALGDVRGLAIDAQTGDLWAVSASDGELSLHRLQLISGRVLSTVRLAGIRSDVVAIAYAAGVGLVAADAAGDLWRVRPSGRADKLASLEYVPVALAADGSGSLYVAPGGPRLARFQLVPFRRLEVIELDASAPAASPFAIAAGRLHVVVPVHGGYEIRRVPLRK